MLSSRENRRGWISSWPPPLWKAQICEAWVLGLPVLEPIWPGPSVNRKRDPSSDSHLWVWVIQTEATGRYVIQAKAGSVLGPHHQPPMENQLFQPEPGGWVVQEMVCLEQPCFSAWDHAIPILALEASPGSDLKGWWCRGWQEGEASWSIPDAHHCPLEMGTAVPMLKVKSRKSSPG